MRSPCRITRSARRTPCAPRRRIWTGFDGDVAILYADAPLLPPRCDLFAVRARAEKRGMAVLAFEAADPTGYGRLIHGTDQSRWRASWRRRTPTPKSARSSLCNSGVLCADAKGLFQLLAMVKNENAKGEYLSDRCDRPWSFRWRGFSAIREAASGCPWRQFAR